MSKNNAPSVYAEISRIYHDPAANSLVPPLAKIDFLFDNGSMATAFLPPDQLTTSGLKKAVPRLRGLPDIRPLVRELNTQFADIMDGTVSNFETFSGLAAAPYGAAASAGRSFLVCAGRSANRTDYYAGPSTSAGKLSHDAVSHPASARGAVLRAGLLLFCCGGADHLSVHYAPAFLDQ